MLDSPPYFCGYMPMEPTGDEAKEVDNYLMQIAKRDNEQHMAMLRVMLLGILIHDLKKIQERRSS